METERVSVSYSMLEAFKTSLEEWKLALKLYPNIGGETFKTSLEEWKPKQADTCARRASSFKTSSSYNVLVVENCF